MTDTPPSANTSSSASQRVVANPPAMIAPGKMGYNLLRPQTSVLTFVFKDVFDNPIKAPYLLEYPDGFLEDGELDVNGTLHKKNVPPGTYTVHFPRLTQAQWKTEALTLTTEKPGTKQATLKIHSLGFKPGGQIKIELYYEGQEDSGLPPIHTLSATLPGESAKRTEEQTVTAIWDMTGLSPVRPGDVYRVVFTARAEPCLTYSSNALTLYGPPLPLEKSPDEEPETAESML